MGKHADHDDFKSSERRAKLHADPNAQRRLGPVVAAERGEIVREVLVEIERWLGACDSIKEASFVLKKSCLDDRNCLNTADI